MDQQTVIEDLEARAKAAGVSMRQVCIEADIHPTTFSRWKKSERNPNPIGATLASLGKLEIALKHFEEIAPSAEPQADAA